MRAKSKHGYLSKTLKNIFSLELEIQNIPESELEFALFAKTFGLF